MRSSWVIALVLLPLAAVAKPPATVGVAELSCGKEIAESLCSRLTERLVVALREKGPDAVIRQSEARKKQRDCREDAACVARNRPAYDRIVSGTVRSAERGVEISLRLLDAKRMEKLAESSVQAPSSQEGELLSSVDEAAGKLLQPGR